jgi:hypothetical protein
MAACRRGEVGVSVSYHEDLATVSASAFGRRWGTVVRRAPELLCSLPSALPAQFCLCPPSHPNPQRGAARPAPRIGRVDPGGRTHSASPRPRRAFPPPTEACEVPHFGRISGRPAGVRADGSAREERRVDGQPLPSFGGARGEALASQGASRVRGRVKGPSGVGGAARLCAPQVTGCRGTGFGEDAPKRGVTARRRGWWRGRPGRGGRVRSRGA